jgi:signal transduction histidine kinase
MKHQTIEPGLLRVFRWFVGIRLVLLLLSFWSVQRNPDVVNPRSPALGIVLMLVLLVLLTWGPAERLLGRAFLPLALLVASVGPLLEHAVTVATRVARGSSANQALADYWQLFFLLFVPLLLIAWQYRYRAVVLFAVGTTLLDVSVTIPLLRTRSLDLPALGGLAFVRGLLFAFVGIFVVKLVAAQREARAALTRHGAMLEQLATSRERNRLARELHDTLAHSLSAVAVQLEAVRSLWDLDPKEARIMLDRSLQGARRGLGEARRAIHALRASPLEERGLVGALQQLCHTTAQRSGLAVRLVPGDVGELAPSLEQVTYRIADEALSNAVRHSGGGRAEVGLKRRGDRLQLIVSDDGVGFDPAAVVADGHFGLQGMRERAELVGGDLTIESRSGEGTTVRFEVGVGS